MYILNVSSEPFHGITEFIYSPRKFDRLMANDNQRTLALSLIQLDLMINLVWAQCDIARDRALQLPVILIESFAINLLWPTRYYTECSNDFRYVKRQSITRVRGGHIDYSLIIITFRNF